jgi:hypothetical protein
MAIVLTLLSSQINGAGGRGRVTKRYSVAASGSYAGSGTTGDLIDYQGALNPGWIERAKFARIPDQFAVLNQPAGFIMRIEPSYTDYAGSGIRFFQSDDAVDPLDEVADGAYPAGITGSDGAPLLIEISGPAI